MQPWQCCAKQPSTPADALCAVPGYFAKHAIQHVASPDAQARKQLKRSAQLAVALHASTGAQQLASAHVAHVAERSSPAAHPEPLDEDDEEALEDDDALLVDEALDEAPLDEDVAVAVALVPAPDELAELDAPPAPVAGVEPPQANDSETSASAARRRMLPRRPSAPRGQPTAPYKRALEARPSARRQRQSRWASTIAAASPSISSSVCVAISVIRSRSVPFGTDG